MWKYSVLLLCLSGYCLAGPVGLKRNMPIGVQQRADDAAEMTAESEMASSGAEPSPAEMMIMSTLTLPSNATSIRADITDNFSCENKTYGYYADVDNDCQIFHVCLPVTYADGKENTFRWSFICPEETVFSQDSFTCMRPEDMAISCEDSLNYYELNRNFGMIAQDSEKENSDMPAAEVSETVMEAELQPEVMQPTLAMQEPMQPAEESIKVQKPNRRKPGLSYAAQKKPINSHPLRKIPQAQPEVNAIVVNQASEASEPIKPVQEEEIKPVIQKFTRRPAPVMSNTFKDKMQSSKTETLNALRSDLYNQKRKRPTMFNKKPIEQQAEEEQEKVETEPIKEESQVEEKVPEQNFSPMEFELSNGNSETQVADSENEASQTQEVFVKPEEPQAAETSEMVEESVKVEEEPQAVESEEPVQVLEAFEEIPAVIAEVMETVQAEEEEEKKEEEMTQIQTAEETQNVEEAQIADEAQVAEVIHPVEESENAEEIQIAQEAETLEKDQTAQETETVEQVLDVQEPEAIESEVQTAEETQNAAETQQFEEVQTVQETQDAEEVQTAEEPQSAEETQNAEEVKTAEEMQSIGETQQAEEVEETQNVEGAQTEEEIQTVEGTQYTEEAQAAGEAQTAEEAPIAEEIPSAEETKNAEEVPTAEDTQSIEETQNVEVAQTGEATQINAEETRSAEETPEAQVAEESEPIVESEVLEETKATEESQDAVAPQLEEQKPQETEEPNVAEESENTESVESVKTNAEIPTPEEPTLVEESVPVEDLKMEAADSSPIAEETELVKSGVPADTETEQEQPAVVASEPAIFEENSEEAAAAVAPIQTIEEMEDERPVEAPESMSATEEMAEQDPMVQQMFEEGNDEENKKQTIGGFKPVDPVMAAEAEQLIADFINTLRRNEFTNEKPGMPMGMPINEEPEQVPEQVAEEVLQVEEDPEIVGQVEAVKDNEAEELKDEVDAQPQIVETQVSSDENKTVEMEDAKEPQEEAKPEAEVETNADSNEVSFLKSSEVHSSEVNEEAQHQEEQPAAAPVSVPDMIMSHVPQEIYQIPVEVVSKPLEEMPQQQSEEQIISDNSPVDMPVNNEEKNEAEAPAMFMGGYKPLSIDDIVELVKERLDQKPKDDMETPMQLDQVLSEGKPNANKLEETAASEDQQSQETQLSEEEIVMPIYHRLADPAQVEAEVQTDSQDASAVATDAVVAPSAQEKSNRSFRSRSMLSAKLDPRKRRFLFRSDES